MALAAPGLPRHGPQLAPPEPRYAASCSQRLPAMFSLCLAALCQALPRLAAPRASVAGSLPASRDAGPRVYACVSVSCHLALPPPSFQPAPSARAAPSSSPAGASCPPGQPAPLPAIASLRRVPATPSPAFPGQVPCRLVPRDVEAGIVCRPLNELLPLRSVCRRTRQPGTEGDRRGRRSCPGVPVLAAFFCAFCGLDVDPGGGPRGLRGVRGRGSCRRTGRLIETASGPRDNIVAAPAGSASRSGLICGGGKV